MTIPAMPLGRTEPPIRKKGGTNPNAADTQSQSEALPKMRNHGLSIEDDRSHFQPRPQIWRGRRNAPMPNTWRNRSAHRAPKSPSRLWVRVPAETVFHEESAGENDSRLSTTARPSNSNKNPTASFSRVYRDGENKVIRQYGRKLPERPPLCQMLRNRRFTLFAARRTAELGTRGTRGA